MSEAAGEELAALLHQNGIRQFVERLDQPFIQFGCQQGIANSGSGHRLNAVGRCAAAGVCRVGRLNGRITATARSVSFPVCRGKPGALS